MRKRSIIQMVFVGVVVGVAVAVVAYFIPWLPQNASEEATSIDRVYWFVTIICIAIFALVAAVSVYSVWKFRAPPDDNEDGSPIHGHTGLEIVWTAVPAALVTAISIYSGVVLAGLENAPDGSRKVNVSGQQFAWSFSYPGTDVTSGQLVLEVDKAVQLTLTSKDVIHSFWVPEFRMKQDAVPGTETHVVITPTKVGTYEVICTELCGLGHAVMRSQAVVLGPGDYEKWMSEQKAGGAAAGGGGSDGKALFASNGCGSCHTLADAGSTAQVGPNLDEVLKDKDAEFVRTSIMDPDAEIAPGFQPGIMPKTFGDQLSDEQLDALVKYLLDSTKGG